MRTTKRFTKSGELYRGARYHLDPESKHLVTFTRPTEPTHIPFTPLYRTVSKGMNKKEKATLLVILRGMLKDGYPVAWDSTNLFTAFAWQSAESLGFGTQDYWKAIWLAEYKYNQSIEKEAE